MKSKNQNAEEAKTTASTDTPKAEAQPAEAKAMDAVPETNVVDELTKKYDELNDSHLRLAAEFENYRKRSKREQESAIRFANEKFALDIVDILDNFERALKSDDEHLREGLAQIHKLYLSILSRNGIEPMNAKGTQFDP
ncbi:MAG: nucleotide exchange factor GrpE, partial [Methanocorpusculum sp.]|nr:nucleotide exchange factor GrpE [Methanocorpusculum sp.]